MVLGDVMMHIHIPQAVIASVLPVSSQGTCSLCYFTVITCAFQITLDLLHDRHPNVSKATISNWPGNHLLVVAAGAGRNHVECQSCMRQIGSSDPAQVKK